MLTNKGLVEHVKMALNEKWGYVWGTFGQVFTESLFKQKLNQYPSGVGNYADFIQANWLNRRTADCVGLIKSFLWWINGDATYTPSTDVSADGMYQKATEKGNINSLPEIPGVCLWKPGHIGVYIGDGKVIEARGTTSGVIASSLDENNPGWTHWLKCPYISYEGGYWTLIKKGDKGPEVSELQANLNILGYGLIVDGDFGPGTEAAVKSFQCSNHLDPDGVVGPVTLGALEQAVIKVDVPQPTSPVELTVDAALQILVDNGIINSPEYWQKAVAVVTYLDRLIINMATKLKG